MTRGFFENGSLLVHSGASGLEGRLLNSEVLLQHTCIVTQLELDQMDADWSWKHSTFILKEKKCLPSVCSFIHICHLSVQTPDGPSLCWSDWNSGALGSPSHMGEHLNFLLYHLKW